MRHIVWLIGSIAVLLLAACGGGDSIDDVAPVPSPTPTGPAGPTVLTFYVYAPERPMITRADDKISASDAEKAITSLQIWVFEHESGNKVGYLSPTNYPTTDEGTVYQMNVSKQFADAATKPNVDVYVVANAASVGLTALGENTSREDLEASKIGETDFRGQPTIASAGLPMSGVLRNQAVVGDNPVLRIGNYSDMAKVQLVRAVSKMRFVFCRGDGETVAITGISIDGNMIPTEEYLFLGTDGNSYHVGDSYVTAATELLTDATKITDVAMNGGPNAYLYNGQTAQAYEDLISSGVANGELTQCGPYYFKETDKKMTGTISYQIGSGAVSTASFSMNASSTFARNHSWIVYAYYEGLAGMQIVTVDVLPWTERDVNHNVYNW